MKAVNRSKESLRFLDRLLKPFVRYVIPPTIYDIPAICRQVDVQQHAVILKFKEKDSSEGSMIHNTPFRQQI